MKIKEMDVYFSVPVDRDILRACRKKAGYSSVEAFSAVLKSRGGPRYSDIECNTRSRNKDREKRIRGDSAEVIAEALGMAAVDVFPAYEEAKAAAEEKAINERYKPFTTIEERNAAIVKTMDIAKYTALKYAYYLNYQNLVSTFDKDEALSIAYEALVYAADRAMRKGINKGASFEKHACVVIRNTFWQMRCKTASKNLAFDLFSYDTLLAGEVSAGYCLEDEIIAQLDVQATAHELASALPDSAEEEEQDKLMQEMENRLQSMRKKKQQNARARAALRELGYA